MSGQTLIRIRRKLTGERCVGARHRSPSRDDLIAVRQVTAFAPEGPICSPARSATAPLGPHR